MDTSRKIELDILKGILIICVIIGHTKINPIGALDVYWFHMPIFFVISGYLFKVKSDLCLKVFFFNTFTRYIIPYFSFSLIGFIIFSPENALKNFLRVIYGGINNITIYSYPFWYINCLAISLIIMFYIVKLPLKLGGAIIMIIWMIWHLLSVIEFPFVLPWGIEIVGFALTYMFIGYIIRTEIAPIFEVNKILRTSILFFSLFGVCCIVLANYYHVFFFKLDMAARQMTDPFLDLIIPMSFGLVFLKISRIIITLRFIRIVLEIIGRSSMTIFFTHAGIIAMCRKFVNDSSLEILICLITGIIIYYIIKRFKLSSFYLLGKYKV